MAARAVRASLTPRCASPTPASSAAPSPRRRRAQGPTTAPSTSSSRRAGGRTIGSGSGSEEGREETQFCPSPVVSFSKHRRREGRRGIVVAPPVLEGGGWGCRTTPRGWRWRSRPAPSSAPASSSRRSASCAPASAASAQVHSQHPPPSPQLFYFSSRDPQPRCGCTPAPHRSISMGAGARSGEEFSGSPSIVGPMAAGPGGGGYTYLLEPLWWAGLITMLLGEVANFVAYVFAPAVLVTPLGALSIIVSSVLAHFVLKERLEKLGILGCVSCIVGSVVVVIHAPQEHMPNSVEEIWNLATQPALVLFFERRYGQKNILIYLGICSSMGSLTVVSIKAVGVAITLTLNGMNQLAYPHTWLFVMVATICGVSQLNYLNKALDTFDLAIVSPVYYVMFTTLTIVASGIMFKDGAGQSLSSIVSELCGLITIIIGTILLHIAKQKEATSSAAMAWPLDGGSISWYISLGSDNLLKNVEDDYFSAPQSSPATA